jgi:hypothetical protein
MGDVNGAINRLLEGGMGNWVRVARLVLDVRFSRSNNRGFAAGIKRPTNNDERLYIDFYYVRQASLFRRIKTFFFVSPSCGPW